MQRPRPQTTHGWAAFDRQHRSQHPNIDASSTSDPFPPISHNSHLPPPPSTTSYSLTPTKSKSKSFSSLLQDPLKLLQDANPWADHAIIKDVLGVNNDFNMASHILKSMALDDSHNGQATVSQQTTHASIHENKGFMQAATTDENNGVMNGMDHGEIFSVPTEPEWVEQDDVYFNHRKDALKMMRAASKHSTAASNAFMCGDHALARQLSQQAREEWAEAKKLNKKAANEILMLKNANNDMSKLDLHGLHALEAVHALEEHLSKIECLDKLKMGPGATTTRLRQNILHVVTGTGNHSRGQASLPVAVRSFLIEKGYRFEEARPGVIEVRPKFRYKI